LNEKVVVCLAPNAFEFMVCYFEFHLNLSIGRQVSRIFVKLLKSCKSWPSALQQTSLQIGETCRQIRRREFDSLFLKAFGGLKSFWYQVVKKFSIQRNRRKKSD
jgi:hypothetical protein